MKNEYCLDGFFNRLLGMETKTLNKNVIFGFYARQFQVAPGMPDPVFRTAWFYCITRHRAFSLPQLQFYK